MRKVRAPRMKIRQRTFDAMMAMEDLYEKGFSIFLCHEKWDADSVFLLGNIVDDSILTFTATSLSDEKTLKKVLSVLLSNKKILHLGNSGFDLLLKLVVRECAKKGWHLLDIGKVFASLVSEDMRYRFSPLLPFRPIWNKKDWEYQTAPILGDLEAAYGNIKVKLDLCHSAASDNTELEISKKKIYISGPISNNENYAEEFDTAERALKEKGYDPINPVKLAAEIVANKTLSEEEIWKLAMDEDLAAIVYDADGIVLLDQKGIVSKGVTIESEFAAKLGMSPEPLSTYLKRKPIEKLVLGKEHDPRRVASLMRILSPMG